jgi:hypothetical protein
MKFLADVMVARLGRWLRLFGYDTAIANGRQSDDEILAIAKKENRLLLTRDKVFYQRARKAVKAHYFVSRGAKAELREIVKTLKLEIDFPKKTRCSVCNGTLKKMSDFWVCNSCKQTYWAGSHWARIRATMEAVKR